MSDGHDSNSASMAIPDSPMAGAVRVRKRWIAPKVIVSSFASTAVKKGATPIDTPRPGIGTTSPPGPS
jgi:hypothetical protein